MPNSRLSLSCAEASKTTNFDLISISQRTHHTVENGFDNHLGLFPCHLQNARKFFDQVSLSHVTSP